MHEHNEAAIRTAVIAALHEAGPQREGMLNDPPSNLLEVVDSFGFVQIIMSVENALKLNLDLTEVDLGSIVEFDRLVEFLKRQSAAAA
jgi:acyl carrier protein